MTEPLLTLTIERIGAFGDGMAKTDDGLAFVPATCVGDVVKARPVQRSAQGLICALVEVIASGAGRAAPPCEHFPRCGGCRLQHLSLQVYSAHKQQQVQELLDKAGLQDMQALPPVLSPPQSRRRASFSIRHEKNGLIAGFNAWHSHDVIDLRACSVVHPALFAALQKLKPWLQSWLPRHKACDLHLTTIGGDLDAVLIGGSEPSLKQREHLARMAEECDVARVSWKRWDRSPLHLICQRRQPILKLGKEAVALPAGTFLQATAEGEAQLIALTQQAMTAKDKVVDLFCGIGTFALSLSTAKQVTAYDANVEAIQALRQAMRGQPQRSVFERDLVQRPLLADELKQVDVVIIDPPRGGAKSQMQQLAASQVRTVVSISCDAASFVRDAVILRQAGFQCAEVHLIDQFLWSLHIELHAVFRRL